MDEGKILSVNDGVDGVFEVVEDRDLHRMTGIGWRLVRVLESKVAVGSRTEVIIIPPTYAGGQSSTRDNYIPEYGPAYRYLLRQGRDEHVAGLNEHTAALDKQLETQAAQIKNHEEQQKALQVERDRAKSEATSRADMLQEVRDRERALREQVRKMELDLGKVRKDIGDREFNRIVSLSDDEKK